jgi:anti-sigma B factor antagonist
MHHFFVNVTHDQRECVITVSGELDIEHAPQLASVAQVAMTSACWGVLVVDLTNVPFVDSTGLGSLVDLHAAVTSAGRTVRLRGVQKPVRKVIEITGLTGLLVPTDA